MAKLKHTKNELRKQRESLKRYYQYLPVLLLKKQQLQMELIRIHHEEETVKQEKAYLKAVIYKWADVFAEETDIRKIVKVKEIALDTGNIAGMDIPVFKEVLFYEEKYDLFTTPLWVDDGIAVVKKVTTLNARLEILKKQEELVKDEFRTTTQRVNLFEKIKIPETEENIRRIRIFLGDMETAAVVRGKIAKAKIEALA